MKKIYSTPILEQMALRAAGMLAESQGDEIDTRRKALGLPDNTNTDASTTGSTRAHKADTTGFATLPNPLSKLWE